MRLFRFALFLLCIHELNAQCPITDFSIPATACINQRIIPNNLSTGAVTYEWDFCSGDLENDPTASGIITNAFLVRGRSFRIVNSSTGWYGFSIDQVNNVLLRFDFGQSPSSIPTITNLGNPGGLLQAVFDFELYSESGNWYALVVNATGNSIIKLSFGSSLSSQPVATSVVSLSDGPRGIALVNDQVNLYAFVTTSLTATISRLDFGNTINNAPQVNTIVVPSAINLRGISFIKQCNSWFAAVTDYNQNLVHLLNFNSGIASSPTSSLVSTGSVNLNFPASISLQQEGGKYFALIQSAVGNLYRLSFGANLSSTPQASKDFGNFGISSDNFPLAVANSQSSWMGFSIDNTNGRLIRLSFPNLCSGNIFVSTQSSPTFQYTGAGNYRVTLKAFDSSGNSSSHQNNIIISSQQAPDIDFTSQNVCAGNSINFTSINSSADINSYSWDFGNGNVSASTNPSTVYTSSGDYTTTLNITANSGCSNAVQKSLYVFNKPTATFSLPSALIPCTNQNFSFVNTTLFDIGLNPTWQWSVNGTNVSTTKDLISNFSTATSQTIQLIASIPGCSSQSTQLFNVQQQGPLVDFNVPAVTCQNTPVNFNNLTTGSVTSYSWTYGDGNSSNTTTGANTYSSIGGYNVTLQASNAAGCQNSITNPITIYSKPQANFSIGLPPFSCAGTLSQFTDATPSPTDSNLTNWSWNFGDSNNGISTLKNPAYAYLTPNSYNVSLTVGTNFGCNATIQKAVTISPSPIASFTNSAACVNQVTQFTDASSGSIQSRQWKILGNVFTSPNPQFTFSSSNTFPVQLTVTGTNGCIGQIINNIIVPVAPSLDFTFQIPCATNATTFAEVTNNIDPVVSRGWVFGSLANGSGSPVQFTFPTPNTYLVKLNSTRQSGCVYSVSKNISIINPPIADFTASVDAGPAPLDVSFVNNSFQATSYQWTFGDKNNSTSALQNPSFIFSELGDYTVQLKASNAFNCSNQFSRVISVVIPKIDLVMNDFYLTNDGSGASQPTVSIINKSNVNVIDPNVIITSSDGAQIKKKISGTLKPNQEVIQQLDFLIVPRSSNYLCAEVLAIGDVDLFLNRKCLTLNGDEILFSPFPNPAKTQLNLDWISVDGSDVSFQVVNSYGSIFLQQSVSGILKGVNRLVVNTSNLASGVYFIRFKDSKKDKAFSFIVSGN